MEDIDCWEEKFEVCKYANRLLDKVNYLNKLVKQPIDLREIKKGIYYARKYHGTQMRQSGEPYYSHPVEVAYLLAEYAAHEAPYLYKPHMLNVSLLHDTMEDTSLKQENIAALFDKHTASQVEALTRIKPYGKITSEELVNLLIKEKNTEGLFIKLFDRIHNMQTINAKSPEKAIKIIKETTLIFITLSAYLGNLKLEKELYNLCLHAARTFKLLPLT